MGSIRIVMGGSFGYPNERTFTANEEGHAKAVADAIKWLAEDILPKAITNDHECQRDDQYPTNKFGLE